MMMKKLGLVLLMACAIALPATAQTKISGKQTCAKPDPMQSIDVGDKPGHSVMIQKAACKWDTGLEIEGTKSTESTDVSTAEVWGTTATQHGYNMGTMDNGDKFTVKWTGTMKVAKDGTAAFDGKWTFISGTGKLMGIKGSGTYKGTGSADGSGTVDVEGDYTIAMAAMKPAK
jgi:hypothetical protein